MNAIKSTTIFLILILATGRVSVSGSDYKLVQDSIYFYEFNTLTEGWDFTGANYYYYSNGHNDSIITVDRNGVPTSRTINIFDGGKLMQVHTSVMGVDGWQPSQDQILTYDDLGRLAVRVVTRWKNDQWENLNTFTYIYNENSRLEVYKRDFWMNNSWTYFTVDSLFYDENNLLAERSVRLISTGKYITRTLYEYNTFRKRIAQIRQDFIDNDWVNISRTLFYYNKCGTATHNETERWQDGNWQEAARSEVFYHYEISPDVTRVPVCNRGNTRYVSIHALDGFLSRGACLGECLEEKNETRIASERDAIKSQSLPFIVYPNPAREMVTVKMASDECPATEIVLLDYSGRLVQKIKPGNKTEIPIDLSSLKRGNYILKVTSDSVYSTIISKQ